jgi:hypothetical protein
LDEEAGAKEEGGEVETCGNATTEEVEEKDESRCKDAVVCRFREDKGDSSV